MALPRIVVLGAPTPFGLHPRLLRRVIAAASRQPWRVRVHLVPPDPGPLPVADGYLAPLYTAAIGKRLQQSGVPVVNLDGAIDLPIARVGTDPERMAELAVAHLSRGRPLAAAYLGHRDRADSLLLGNRYLERMRAAGLPTRRLDLPGSWRSLASSAHEEAISDHRVRRWMRDLPRPCALLTWSEDVAMHAAELAHGILTVGHDLRLLSAGEAPELLASAGISAITRDLDQLASSAVALLAGMLAGTHPADETRLIAPLAVIERRSTCPPLADDPAIARVLDHLRQHLAQPPTMRALCRIADVPERTLRRRFIAAVGRSPQAESIRLRLQHAQALLAAGHAPAEAARQSGFRRADSVRRALAGRHASSA